MRIRLAEAMAADWRVRHYEELREVEMVIDAMALKPECDIVEKEVLALASSLVRRAMMRSEETSGCRTAWMNYDAETFTHEQEHAARNADAPREAVDLAPAPQGGDEGGNDLAPVDPDVS